MEDRGIVGNGNAQVFMHLNSDLGSFKKHQKLLQRNVTKFMQSFQGHMQCHPKSNYGLSKEYAIDWEPIVRVVNAFTVDQYISSLL